MIAANIVPAYYCVVIIHNTLRVITPLGVVIKTTSTTLSVVIIKTMTLSGLSISCLLWALIIF